MKTRRFLRSDSAKTSPLLIIAIIFVALVAFGVIDLSGFEFDLPFSAATTGGETSVNKAVQFGLIDGYAGTKLTSKTLLVYDADTFSLRDTLTTDGTTGKVATTHNYDSGTRLYVYYENTNDKEWFDVTVPYMTEADAQANTYNDVTLESFAIGTYTSDTLMHSGTSLADADDYNKTVSGNTVTFTYTLANSGSDNTGLKTSYDPVYDCDYDIWVVVSFAGTNYETIVLSGFDKTFTIGTTQYGADRLSANELTKWKVGGAAVPGYSGVDSCSWSVDLTGYSGDAADMQVSAKAYADIDYAIAHGGNYGPEDYEIAEQTVDLVD